jgi:two-component system response regulator YesN
MYRVLLVDDDSIIRIKLRNILEWEKLNCMIIAEASNGSEAIAGIRKYTPNIIITDIDMPGMNGVDLINYINDNCKDVAVIALSAYDDFEYVRDSLKNGAVDYILKHQLTTQRLEIVINEAISKIAYSEKKNEITKSELLSDDEKFEQLINNGFENEDKNKRYIIAIAFFDNMDYIRQLTPKHFLFFKSVLRETIQQYEKQILVKFDTAYVSFILIDTDKDDAVDIMDQECDNCGRFLNQKLRYIMSEKLNTSDEPYRILNNLIMQINSCNLSSIKENTIQQSNDHFKPLSLDDIKLLDSYLEEKNDERVFSLIDTIYKTFLTNNYGLNQTKYASVELINILNKHIQNNHYKFDDMSFLTRYVYKINLSDSLETIKSEVIEAYRTYIATAMEYKDGEFDNSIINESIEYINDNIEQTISLRDVAAYVSINSAYLSRLFKKVTGKTIVTYINEAKIKKAQEFIDFGELSLKEISYKLGFLNYNHFYSLYRDIVGMPPSESKNK